MNKEKVLMIICLIFFICGVASLVLSFIYKNTNIYLMIALGCIGAANIILFVTNIIFKKGIKKIK